MQKIVFRYGMYATLLIVGLSAFLMLVVNRFAGYAAQEIAGYLTMLLSMVFVFFGIRQYRDKVNNGTLTFGQGMKVGLLIVLIPAVFFGLFDILYTEVINPNWLENYYGQYIARIKASTPVDQLEAALKKANDQKMLFSNPVMQFLLMAATVLIIGFIVTIIASLTLRRRKIVTA